MSRSSFFTSLFALCLLAPVGCAATTSEDEVADAQDELSSVATSLVGKYFDHAVPFAGIGRLTLESNGKYSARVEAGGRAFCITSPCLLPESGTWTAVKGANGALRLRLTATGEAARWYDAKKENAVLELTAAGKTQKLTALGANQCLDSADCGADAECGPRFCLMFCAVSDPFCCGPSTCQPKAPVRRCGGFAGLHCATNEDCIDDPTDSCDPTTGGMDCSGTCQPKPPSGPTCGNTQCAVGEVCCNPLSSICTKPGEFCAF